MRVRDEPPHGQVHILLLCSSTLLECLSMSMYDFNLKNKKEEKDSSFKRLIVVPLVGATLPSHLDTVQAS